MTEIKVVGAGGEYMESVVVVEWHKKPGDLVKVGELVVTVETAKAATEIEAPTDGVLSKILAKIGDEVPLGAVLGIIGEDAEATDGPAALVEAAPSTPLAPPFPLLDERGEGGRIVASPLARRVATQLNVDLSKVKVPPGSRRIRLRDVEAFANQMNAAAPVVVSPLQNPPPVAPMMAKPSNSGLNIATRGNPSAEKIVLLHGFGSDGLSWQPLLTAIGGGFHFVLVDLPAHGRSSRNDVGRSVHELAEGVLDALSQAGVDDFHLVGHSLGGAVSLALSAFGRLSIRSLTLLAPAGLGPDIDGGFISGFARASKTESLKPWLLKLFANPAFVSPAFISATMAARTDPDLREAQSQLALSVFPDGTQAANLRDVFRDLLIPQKIIWGDQDRVIPMQHAFNTGGAAGLHFLPGVGHLPHVEAAAAVARLVLQNVRSATV